MKQSESLDNWREYFRRGDSDIFGIIDYAIMVAAADCSKEFKSRRDSIAELLFSSRVSSFSASHGRKTVETIVDSGSGDYDESNNQIVSNHTYGEASVIVDELKRIKDILLNKYEPKSVVLESLTNLKSIPMSVDILKDTGIGKAVNGLRKHSSDKISKLAKTLVIEWKELVVHQLNNTPKEISCAEGTPESTNLSAVEEEEEEVFPSPPHDLDIFANEHSQILATDEPRRQPNQSRELMVPAIQRKPFVVVERKQKLARQPSPDQQDKPEALYSEDFDIFANELSQILDCDVIEETDVRPMKHLATDERKPLVVTERKQKLAGPKQDKLKDLYSDAKLELAKRKLHESYQEHENAKRQKRIQVLDTIPNQSKAQKPQFKRLVPR